MSTTVDVTAKAALARGAYIDAIAVDDLFVDGSYQRPPDLTRVRHMAARWDRRLAGVIEVSDRGEEAHPRYAVIDGQHRWEAARLRDPAPMLVATIHEGLGVADEARLFDRLNRERRRPSTWDHWRARKTSGDAGVLAIEGAVCELGLRIDSAPRAGNVRCTATLEKLAALGGTELVGETLKLITDVGSADRLVRRASCPRNRSDSASSTRSDRSSSADRHVVWGDAAGVEDSCRGFGGDLDRDGHRWCADSDDDHGALQQEPPGAGQARAGQCPQFRWRVT